MRFAVVCCTFTVLIFLAPTPQFAQNDPPQPAPSASTTPLEYNDPDAAQPPAAAKTLAPATSQPPSPTASATTARKLVTEVDVPSSQQWTDTGIDVNAGDRLTIAASGSLQGSLVPSIGPSGLARSWNDLVRSLPVNAAGTGALIGRIGDDPATVPFLVGAEKQTNVTRAGRLFLGINRTSRDQVDGSFHAKIQITPASSANAAPTPAALKTTAPSVDPAFLSRVPRRVTDVSGNLGDVVNFIMIGPQQKVQQAFQAAGWVLVDRTKSEAVLHALLSSTSKQAYTEMPMSELYLFKRPQDFGYARAEPVQVVASRHHLRLWKAPFEVDGRTVWAGAATHDIGFEKDQRTGGVTHKIDPNIDVERDFVAAGFKDTGTMASVSYVTPADAVHEAHTATGGSFQTDGRVLVLVLEEK